MLHTSAATIDANRVPLGYSCCWISLSTTPLVDGEDSLSWGGELSAVAEFDILTREPKQDAVAGEIPKSVVRTTAVCKSFSRNLVSFFICDYKNFRTKDIELT